MSGWKDKVVSMGEAVERVRSVDTLGIPLGPGQPGAFLHALGDREDYESLEIFGALLVDLYGVFTKKGVKYVSGFFGPAERILRDLGSDVQFVPADFRRFGPLLAELKPRVMTTVATAPDAEGYMSLSLYAGASVEALHEAGADPDRLLVVEADAAFPYTVGLPPEHMHRIHVDEVDVLVESDRPPFVLADAEATDVEEAIAEFALEYIDDGCTLQTGIGGIPSTIARLLAEKPGGDYGVHSEMFTTGLMHLHQAGKVTNAHKGIFEGYSVTTFAAGTEELYAWLDGNDEVRFLPVSYVNAPEIIARNHRMITINGAVSLDLAGQVVADTIGARQYSGIGGHEDFISAPGLELDDRSLVCLPSTATVDGQLVSRIVAHLPLGSVVTTPRHQLDVVITEYGHAELRGKTVRERALALADIAHPDFRAELRDTAAQMG
ncbi:MAG: acetyl-CoA hydrolase/transferase C-terminal domain-containing protein [Acidimicrobiales bacterium]